MFKSKCCVFIIIAFCSISAMHCAGENVELREDIENLLNNLPQHLEEALNLEEKDEQLKQNRSFPLMSQCSRDFRRIFTSMVRGKMWPFKVIDSWGKFPSGILSGNLYEFGDFDQCLSIDVPKEFVPQYCLARVGKNALVMPETRVIEERLKTVASIVAGYGDSNPQARMLPTAENIIALSFGICIPKSCTREKVTHLLKTVQKWIFLNKIDLSLVPDACQVKEDLGWNLNAGDYACLVLLIALVAAMIFSTAYDFIQMKLDKEKHPLLNAFSVYTNGKKLFSCKRSKNGDTMECLNGIRMFSAFWVIYGHAHIMSFFGPTYNLIYLSDWSEDYSSLFVLSGFFAVDSFLFLSGFLATLSVLKTLTKTNGRMNVLRNYLHRYVRLTPILAVVVIFSLTLYKKISSGPVWYTYILNGIFCDKYWWSTLLYIQNYVNPDTICLSHTWYLSMDMQLFLFSPLFGYLYYRFGNYFTPVIVILVAISSGWTYWLYMHFDLVNQILNMTNDIQRTFSLTYFPTHVRMAPWLIGVAFGYFLFKTHGRKEKWSKARVVIHWIVATAIALFIIFYSHRTQKMTHSGTPLESAIFTPLSRIGWTVFLCMLVYACLNGYGGPVNWFLSLPQWQPFARLSYAIYLIHMPVMLMEAASLHRPQYFSGRTVLFKFCGDAFITTLLSIFASLALEYPMVIIESNLLSGKKKHREAALPSTTRGTLETQQPTAPEST